MTALGIDNSGLLKIPYGKEDIDKDELGAYIYNAAENIFWRRIRTLMNRQLTTLYSNTNLTSCWSANNLINEFDKWQNQFPEELWRLDIERKYIRPYQIGSWVQKDRVYSRDRTFLEGMANGRKKYQRRQFERDQEVYVATKYLQSAIFADSVEMRLATADPESAAVVPINDTIKITPYSDMYIRVMFGNTDVVSKRAKAGVEYEISPPFTITSRNTLQITVYAASRIQAFSDLSAFYIRDNNFSRATKLKTLVLGNPTPGYKNTALTSVGIGDNVLLETLDLRNLPNLTGTLNLTNCKNLKNLYASNTSLTAVNFANGGKITNADLPGTLNSLIFRNLSLLTNLNVAGYNSLTTLVSENSNVVNPLSIVQAAINTLQAITVTDLIWTLDNITILNNIYSKSTSLLSGLATITGGIKREEIIKYNEKWPDLELNLSNANITEQWEITFTYTDTAGNSHTYKEYVEDGNVAPDPMYLGVLSPVPGKPSETEVDYVFGTWARNSTTGEMEYQEYSGWRRYDGGMMSPVGATSNVEYVAVYNTTPRKYAVEWYADNVKIDETSTGYGTQAVTDKMPNNKWDSYTQTAQIFAGWDKSTGQVKENMVGDNRVNAVWLSGTIPTAEELAEKGLNGLNEAQIYALSKTDSATRTRLLANYIRDYKEIRLGNDYDYTNVESTVLVEDDEILGYNSSGVTDERTIKIFDGQPHYNQTLPNIRPLSYENGFTIALDFKVHQVSGESQNYVLTCFQNIDDVEKGFKIVSTSNGDVNITWGSSSNARQIGTQGQRNIVVIRKARNDNNLYVYYDSASINGALVPNISQFILTGNDNYTEMPLIFGSTGILNANNNSVTLPTEKRMAKSVIYWSKIWNEDLGEAVCKEIASLCHEKIQFQLEGFNDLVSGQESIYKVYSNDEITDKGVNLSFIAGSLLTPYKYALSAEQADPGWSESGLRNICNNRIFNSFPITWRSIIAETPTRTYGRELEDSASNTYVPTDRITVYDKIYIPSAKEVSSNSSYSGSPYSNEGVLQTIPWHASSMQAYSSDGGKSNVTIDRSLVKFIKNSISPDANIFNYSRTQNPYSNSENISNVALKSGDLWIPSENMEVLMYISQEEFNKYKFNEANSDNSNGLRTDGYYDCGGDGAWLLGNSAGYFTRSLRYSQTYAYYGYLYSGTSGALTSNVGAVQRRILIGFSI